MSRNTLSKTLTRRDFLAFPLYYRRSIQINAPDPFQKRDSSEHPEIQFESDFLTDVVMEVIKRDQEVYNRYHKIADQIYEKIPEEERNDAFSELHCRLAGELGFEGVLRNVLREYGGSLQNITRVMVIKVYDRREEGADLRKQMDEEGEIVVMLALRPTRFVLSGENSQQVLLSFLRHELQHIVDMLDPDFEYHHGESLADLPQKENLIRDRYRLLWDITIDGRLFRRGKLINTQKEEHYEKFKSLFTRLPEKDKLDWFESLWNSNHPKHFDLLRQAKKGMEAHGTKSKREGGICHLCNFPTYDWIHKVSKKVQALIQKDFPDWKIEMSLCSRCYEVYCVRAGEW
jgi:hypothetical protein